MPPANFVQHRFSRCSRRYLPSMMREKSSVSSWEIISFLWFTDTTPAHGWVEVSFTPNASTALCGALTAEFSRAARILGMLAFGILLKLRRPHNVDGFFMRHGDLILLLPRASVLFFFQEYFPTDRTSVCERSSLQTIIFPISAAHSRCRGESAREAAACHCS